MEPTDLTSWEQVANVPGWVALAMAMAFLVWKLLDHFVLKKDAPKPPAPAPAPAPAAAPVVLPPMVDAEARERITRLEHQVSTAEKDLARITDLQQQDHDAIVRIGPTLDGMRDALVSLRDDARGKQ